MGSYSIQSQTIPIGHGKEVTIDVIYTSLMTDGEEELCTILIKDGRNQRMLEMPTSHFEVLRKLMNAAAES